MFVPLDSTSFGVQILVDVNVENYVALERCLPDETEENMMQSVTTVDENCVRHIVTRIRCDARLAS